MKAIFFLTYLAMFVLGAMARFLIEPLVAPFVGPAALGPELSMVIAFVLGVGLMHYLTSDKLQRLEAMWNSKSPTTGMLALLLVSFTAAVYAVGVLNSPTEMDHAVRFAAGWALLLSLVATAAVTVVTLRAFARWQPAA